MAYDNAPLDQFNPPLKLTVGDGLRFACTHSNFDTDELIQGAHNMLREPPIKSVVECYKEFLSQSYPSQLKQFCKRHPVSAQAEAVIHKFLSKHSDDVRIVEDPVKGGIDFECETNGTIYGVEVTHLDAAVVSRESGLPNKKPLQTGEARFYGMIPSKLFHKVLSKVTQMSQYPGPSVLVITCNHDRADMVMNKQAAIELLIGEEMRTIELLMEKGTIPRSKSYSETKLESSVFLRVAEGTLEPCYRHISAILLCCIRWDSASFLGVLHPDPQYPFPIELLTSVPFVAIKPYPPEPNHILNTVWYQEQEYGYENRLFFTEELREKHLHWTSMIQTIFKIYRRSMKRDA